jgi:hypothetical protein
MPCEVVPLMVDFFKMAAVAMETANMLKKMKNTKMIMEERKKERRIIIIRIIRNGANTIYLPNFVWGT